MSYDYSKERQSLFTEQGVLLFIKISDNAKKLLATAGAFRAEESWRDCYGSTWQFLACLDRMVELGEIKEVTNPSAVWAQHRIFVSSGGGA